jgi:hypothetical protein
MHEALQLLRESFSTARSAQQEQWYGITTEPWRVNARHPNRPFVRLFLPAYRIVWRNYESQEWGELAIVEASEIVPALTELLDELERLRSLRTMRKAA